MTVLVVGASGATGKLLVEQLLRQKNSVKVVVRSPDKLPASWKDNKHLSIISASPLDLTDPEMKALTLGCHAIASCLGHNLSLKGIYGQPRKLVTEATRRLCESVNANTPEARVKFVLMNTAGNRIEGESISFAEKCVLALIRFLLPPQRDNEKAADYLRIEIGQNSDYIEWVAVRPDSLIDQKEVTEYKAYPSPIRSAIFNAGKTSRINVGHFMATLINNTDLWNKWKGQMPVVYNKSIT